MDVNPKQFSWTQPTEREDGTVFDPLTELRGNNVYMKPVGSPDTDYELRFAATIQQGEEGLEYVLPVSLMTLDEGQYDMVVTALDKQDRESVYSAPIQFEVMTFAPKPPTGLAAS